MSKIINALAKIEVSNEVLQQLNIDSIYQSFSKNYRKLDDLKNFRTEYEKQNKLMRWWHDDKLRDAQLDSAEVQAEFSKTIGQLMMISIMQSKQLSEQQMQLNDQQGKLKNQADGIAEHAGKLQQQHQVLAEQSQELENLVHEYFELKGLTEDGAQKLIAIADDVKTTKNQMIEEFASHAKDLEVEVQSHMESISAQVDKRIRLSEEQVQASIVGVQRDMHEVLALYEMNQRNHHEAAQKALSQGLDQLEQSQRVFSTELQSKQAAFEFRVSDISNKQDQQLVTHRNKLCSIDAAIESLSTQSAELAAVIAETKAELTKSVVQQQNYQDTMTAYQQELFHSLKLLRFFAAGMSIVVAGTLCVMAYIMK